MWRNYLIVAWRTLWSSKVYAVANLVGLAVGLMSALLVFQQIRYELSYERWLPEADSIYRISGASKHPSGEWYYNPLLQASLKPVLEENVPEFQAVTRMRNVRLIVDNGQSAFFEDVTEVDANFFSVIDLPIVRGATLLSNPSIVLISQSLAEKYFGEANPIGQTLWLDADRVLTVEGVFHDLPRNTHLSVNIIVRLDEAALPVGNREPPTVTFYARTAPNADLSFFDKRQAAIVESHFGGLARPGESITDSLRLVATPLSDLHLHDKSRESMTSPITWLYTFAVAAALVLAVALINFVNLSMARAVTRTREISLRQAVGAGRGNLVVQFLLETLLTVLMALGGALALVELIQPWLATYLLQPSMGDMTFASRDMIMMLAGLVVMTTLGAGLYPALFLSRVLPARRLHNAMSGYSNLPRTALVTLQYVVAIVLSLATMIFLSQIRYLNTMDIGFENAGLLALEDVTLHHDQQFAPQLAREISQLPGVEGVTMVSSLPFGQLRQVRQVKGEELGTEAMVLDILPADFGFFEILHAPLLAGRALSADLATDTLPESEDMAEAVSLAASSVVINEEAARTLGFGSLEDAIGTHLSMAVRADINVELTIVGVATNLQWFSARAEVFPTLYYRQESALRHMVVRVAPGQEATVQESMDNLWSRLSPGIPLQRSWVEDRYDQLYEVEARQLRVFSGFTFLILLTANIGIYGLAAWAAETRTKEVGIRKAVGANVADILYLMIWRFIKPVAVAVLIALPVTLYLMSGWLDGFVRRIQLTPLPFFIATIGILFVVLLVTSSQVIRLVSMYPAKVLRETE